MQARPVRVAVLASASIMNSPHKALARRDRQSHAQAEAVCGHGVSGILRIKFVGAGSLKHGQNACHNTTPYNAIEPAISERRRGACKRKA